MLRRWMRIVRSCYYERDSGDYYQAELREPYMVRFQTGFVFAALAIGIMNAFPGPLMASEPAKDYEAPARGYGSFLGGNEEVTSRIERFSDLPATIQEAVSAQLISRVGRSYYARMQYSRGEFTNLDKLYTLNPAKKERQRPLPVYQLAFKISHPAEGIEFYESTLLLDQQGMAIEEIGFPPVQEYPEKAKFISHTQAFTIASRFGVKDPIAQLRYNQKQHSIVFIFYLLISSGSSVDVYKDLEIDAHDGRVLSFEQYEAIK